jgi:hypothetical protein
MTQNWKLPAPGDIVWCLFPEPPDIEPGPKPRPALVFGVDKYETGDFVRVVYGTSQKVTSLKAGEVAISKKGNPAAYALAGLSADTKFDFNSIVELAWSDRYFKVPPRSPHGNTPKLGTLHATVHRAFEAAFRAARTR